MRRIELFRSGTLVPSFSVSCTSTEAPMAGPDRRDEFTSAPKYTEGPTALAARVAVQTSPATSGPYPLCSRRSVICDRVRDVGRRSAATSEANHHLWEL